MRERLASRASLVMTTACLSSGHTSRGLHCGKDIISPPILAKRFALPSIDESVFIHADYVSASCQPSFGGSITPGFADRDNQASRWALYPKPSPSWTPLRVLSCILYRRRIVRRCRSCGGRSSCWRPPETLLLPRILRLSLALNLSNHISCVECLSFSSCTSMRIVAKSYCPMPPSHSLQGRYLW